MFASVTELPRLQTKLSLSKMSVISLTNSRDALAAQIKAFFHICSVAEVGTLPHQEQPVPELVDVTLLKQQAKN